MVNYTRKCKRFNNLRRKTRRRNKPIIGGTVTASSFVNGDDRLTFLHSWWNAGGDKLIKNIFQGGEEIVLVFFDYILYQYDRPLFWKAVKIFELYYLVEISRKYLTPCNGCH